MTATVQVGFKLFGVLPGSVGLRGKIMPVEAGQPHGRGVAGEGDTVKVLFEPPVLSLCNALHFRIGGSMLWAAWMEQLSPAVIVVSTGMGCTSETAYSLLARQQQRGPCQA